MIKSRLIINNNKCKIRVDSSWIYNKCINQGRQDNKNSHKYQPMAANNTISKEDSNNNNRPPTTCSNQKRTVEVDQVYNNKIQ